MNKDKHHFQRKLGQRIAFLRREAGMSQMQLAYKCGKDKQSIGRLETGNVNPTAFYLLQVAEALDMPLRDLLDF